MIIIHVMGGLGNQLYQYALYEKLESLGKKVKLDVSAYDSDAGEEKEWRSFELSLFRGLAFEVCTKEEKQALLDNRMRPADRVRRKLFGRQDQTLREAKEYLYMPELFEIEEGYLYGYWSCERYYQDRIRSLQEKLVFPVCNNPRTAACMEQIGKENAVSLHIRRKDYLTVADGARYMGICTEAYYESAMQYIRQRVENPVFYIFSDDAEYAREHYQGADIRIVDWNQEEDSIYDMQLMSLCKHNICANSTFSIWGARLNRNPDKIMIRPLHHDNYEEVSSVELCRNWKDWVLLDAKGRAVTEQKDKLSIIVPVYNMEQYLARCVDAILAQTYRNLEILLVDDGSTDTSPALCDAYAQQDDRIRVLHKPNGGLSDARNAGLAVATGSYIGYVDSDDWIAPDCYEKLHAACIEKEAQVAVCRYATVRGNEISSEGSSLMRTFDREGLLTAYLADEDQYKIYNSVWSKLFARELVEDLRFPVGRNSEDILYTTKAFGRAEKGVYLDECLYYYVIDREGSIMNHQAERYLQRMFQDELPFWEEQIDWLTQEVSASMGEMAQYYYAGRLLQYFEALSQKPQTRQGALQIAAKLQENKEKILFVYEQAAAQGYGRRGDAARMKLFMKSPQGYLKVQQAYEKIVVAYKNRNKR